MQVAFGNLSRGEPEVRRFEVLYLDKAVKVILFIPPDETREPSYFIFERINEAEAPKSKVNK